MMYILTWPVSMANMEIMRGEGDRIISKKKVEISDKQFVNLEIRSNRLRALKTQPGLMDPGRK